MQDFLVAGNIGRENVAVAYAAFLLGDYQEGAERLLRVWSPYMGLPQDPNAILLDPDPPELPENSVGPAEEEQYKDKDKEQLDSTLNTSCCLQE